MSTTAQLLKEAERLAKNPKTKAQALELMKQLQEHIQMEKAQENEQQIASSTTTTTTNQESAMSDESEDEGEENSGENQMYSALLSLPNKYQKEGLGQTFEGDSDNEDAYSSMTRENCVVSITNMPLGMEEEQLKEFFEQIAPVVSVRLLRSSKTGQSQGMAFVRFTDQEIAQMICSELDHYLIQTKVIRVRMSTIPLHKHDQLFKDASIPYLRRLAMSNPTSRKLDMKLKLAQAQKKAPVTSVSSIVERREKRMIKKQQKWNKRGIEFSVDLNALVAKSSQQPTVAAAATKATPTKAAATKATPTKTSTPTTTTTTTPIKKQADAVKKTTPVKQATPKTSTPAAASRKTPASSAKKRSKN